jgi:hypothetical protein
VIVHSHVSESGSLEGFVLVNGRRIAWSVAVTIAERYPWLVDEIIAVAVTLAPAPRVG